MKKNIILMLFLTFLILPSFASDVVYEQSTIGMPSSKPTDEEIRATIDKFDFDKDQKEYLYKETKKRIDDMYEDVSNDCPLPDYIEERHKSIIEDYLPKELPKEKK